MFSCNVIPNVVIPNVKSMLLAAVVAGGICVSRAVAQAPAQQQSVPSTQAAAPAQPTAPAQLRAPAGRPVPPAQHYQNRLARRAEMYYWGAWGVDELRVKTAESGELSRFNYRVVDPEKAAALNNKKAEPELLDARAGVKLVVPQLPNVGTLRQSSTPKAGMTYWMAFSNPTRAVKRGDHVDVVIGHFHATNLVVE